MGWQTGTLDPKSSPLLVFIDKVLIEHQHDRSFIIVDGCFCASTEVSRGDRAWMAHKTWKYFLSDPAQKFTDLHRR